MIKPCNIHCLDILTNKFERGNNVKTKLHLKVSVTDDENNLVFEIDKSKNIISEEVNKDEVYCDLFDLVGQLQYDIVETSGHEIDFFL